MTSIPEYLFSVQPSPRADWRGSLGLSTTLDLDLGNYYWEPAAPTRREGDVAPAILRNFALILCWGIAACSLNVNRDAALLRDRSFHTRDERQLEDAGVEPAAKEAVDGP